MNITSPLPRRRPCPPILSIVCLFAFGASEQNAAGQAEYYTGELVVYVEHWTREGQLSPDRTTRTLASDSNIAFPVQMPNWTCRALRETLGPGSPGEHYRGGIMCSSGAGADEVSVGVFGECVPGRRQLTEPDSAYIHAAGARRGARIGVACRHL